MKIGRNDLCPCNSGKKYKRCCKGKETNFAGTEEEKAAGARSSPGDIAGGASDEPGPGATKGKSSPLIKRLGDGKSELRSRRPDIHEAYEKLEDYRESYDRLLEDPGEVLQRAESLFAESPFEDMCFTVDELERTFNEVGYPPTAGSSKRFILYIAKAVETMLDEEERSVLSRHLLCRVPDYVNEGRYLDAWIIAHNAIKVCDSPEGECCPFLLCTYMQALRKWQALRDEEQNELFDNLGINIAELQNQDYEKVDKLINDVKQGIKGEEEIKEFLSRHPKLKAQAETDCIEAEAAAIELLERDEGVSLLLDTEEILPWLPVLEERLTAKKGAAEALQTGATLTEEHKQQLTDILYEVSSEMAGAIFTEERLRSLRTKIQKCRRGFTSDNHDVTVGLNGMLMACGASTDPAENHFLTTLCLISMKRVMMSSDGDGPE